MEHTRLTDMGGTRPSAASPDIHGTMSGVVTKSKMSPDLLFQNIKKWRLEDHITYGQIAKNLNEAGIVNPNGGKWYDSNISEFMIQRGVRLHHTNKSVRRKARAEAGGAALAPITQSSTTGNTLVDAILAITASNLAVKYKDQCIVALVAAVKK